MTQNIQTTHKVRRCTSEKAAEKVCDEAAADGFHLVHVTGGGAEGNCLWLIFQRQVEYKAVQPQGRPGPNVGPGATNPGLGLSG